jgi:hypothetical protein
MGDTLQKCFFRIFCPYVNEHVFNSSSKFKSTALKVSEKIKLTEKVNQCQQEGHGNSSTFFFFKK